MKISTKGRYGLRVLMELAMKHGSGPVLVETIARNQDISGKYIHNLMSLLKSADIVSSVRGPSGGFVLSREPKDISLLEAFEVLEGKISPVECVKKNNCCTKQNFCATQEVWQQVSSAIENVLSKFTLQDLATKQALLKNSASMFHI